MSRSRRSHSIIDIAMTSLARMFGVALSVSAVAVATASAPAWSAETAFPRYAQKEGRIDANDTPRSGVTLCVLPEKTRCFEMPPSPIPGDAKDRYQFALNPRSERLPLAGGGSWVFFSGMFSGGGSGMLERIAVLRHTADGRIENLMPEVTATDIADRAMWNVPEVSPYPVFVRADFIWANGEDHFGQHVFGVDGWTFDPAIHQYRKVFSYRTQRRYARGDDDDHVLKAERETILLHLKAAH
jgi:hypothetical protein